MNIRGFPLHKPKDCIQYGVVRALLKPPLNRAIVVSIGVCIIFILFGGGILYFSLPTLPETMASRLSRNDVIAFLRTDDTDFIRQMLTMLGHADVNLPSPATGIYEVAVTPESAAVFMNMRQVEGAPIRVSNVDPISSSLLFEERATLKANPSWMWMKTAALPASTAESELLLGALRKHPEMLAAWDGGTGTLLLTRTAAEVAEQSIFSDPGALRSDRSILQLNVADPRALMDVFTPTQSGGLFEGLKGIATAAIERFAPTTGSTSVLPLLSSPLLLDLQASASGTAFIVMGHADDALLQEFLAAQRLSIPRAEIRAIPLERGITRRDVIASARDIEVLHDWNVLRLDERRFVAVKDSDFAIGNDVELLHAGALKALAGSKRMTGVIDLVRLRAYIQNELPFLDLTALHPILNFLSDTGHIAWTLTDTSTVRRIDWSRSR